MANQAKCIPIIWLCLVLVSTGGLVACQLETPSGPGPRSWIDDPLDGTTFIGRLDGAHFVVDPVIVISHSSNYILKPGSSDTLLADRAGITEISLYASGELVRTDLNPRPDYQGLVQMEQPWVPPAPGEYVLVVRATNRDGITNPSLPVRISVAGGGEFLPSTPTPTPVPTIVSTVPIVLTVTPTPPPTSPPISPIPPTPPPVPAASLPPPVPTTLVPPPALPPQVQFYADSAILTPGQCTGLHWRTQNVLAVYFNNQPVTGNEDRQVCPPSTTTYTLRVDHAGGTINRQAVIQVSAPQPPPPQPPAIPKPVTVSKVCQGSTYTVTVQWTDNANNETGFRVYRNGTLIATLGANVTKYTDHPPLGGPYTFGVEAFNSAGASGRPTATDSGCIF